MNIQNYVLELDGSAYQFIRATISLRFFVCQTPFQLEHKVDEPAKSFK
jgi:hypothetical protein